MKIDHPRFVAERVPDEGGPGVTPAASPPAAPQQTPTPQDGAPPSEASPPRLPFLRGDEPQDSPPGPAGPRRPQQNNPIPYDRVQEIVQTAVQRAIQARDQEYQPFLEQLMERASRQPDQRETVRRMLTAAGLLEDPQAQIDQQPLTRAEARRMFDQERQQFGSALAQRTEVEAGQAALLAAKQQYAEYFADDPMLEQRLIALWSFAPEDPMPKVIEDEIKRINAIYDARTKRYAERKTGDGRLAPPRATGAPAPRGGARPTIDLSTEEGRGAALDEILDEGE